MRADVFGIALSGRATYQIVDMYRYFRKLETSVGQTVNYTEAEKLKIRAFIEKVDEPEDADDILLNMEGDEGLGAVNANDVVSVTGHSLGGHLAVWVQSFFGDRVDSVYTFNGAGVGGLRAEILDVFRDWVFKGEMFSIPNEKIANVYAEQGFEFTAGAGFNEGSLVPTFIEDQVLGIQNHGIALLVDSLAIQSIMQAMAGSLDSSRFKAFAEAISNQPEASIEKLASVLLDLLSLSGSVVIDDRESLHSQLDVIRAELFEEAGVAAPILKAKYQNLSLVETGELQFSATLNTAEGYAYRYALQKLVPFAVVGGSDLYATHNASGELDAENFSREYLVDRAQFLASLTARNYADAGQLLRGDDPLRFVDADAGSLLTGTSQGNPSFFPSIVFGNNVGDAELEGFNGRDRIYGIGGDDVLAGNAAKTVSKAAKATTRCSVAAQIPPTMMERRIFCWGVTVPTRTSSTPAIASMTAIALFPKSRITAITLRGPLRRKTSTTIRTPTSASISSSSATTQSSRSAPMRVTAASRS